MEYVAWITIQVHLPSLSFQSIFFPFESLSFGQMAQTEISFHVIPFFCISKTSWHISNPPPPPSLSNHLQSTAVVSDSVSPTVSVEASSWWFFFFFFSTLIGNIPKKRCRMFKYLFSHWDMPCFYRFTSSICIWLNFFFKKSNFFLWLVTWIIAWH